MRSGKGFQIGAISFLVVIFLFSSVLTPPDLVSQLILAGPLLVMYEGSIWMAKLFQKKEEKKEEEKL